MTTAYPLAWPQGKPRRTHGARKVGKFSTAKNCPGQTWRSYESVSIAEATRRLQAELDRIGAGQAVLSSNLELRLDGSPRSGQAEPIDPGVAVYFQLAGKPHCLPCDTYTRAADNIAAVAAHIEATRAIERHGVASIAEMFTGFQALPAPGSTPWWRVLQVPETAPLSEAEAAFRKLAAERHPDLGGSDAMMADLNRARDEARKARGTS